MFCWTYILGEYAVLFKKICFCMCMNNISLKYNVIELLIHLSWLLPSILHDVTWFLSCTGSRLIHIEFIKMNLPFMFRLKDLSQQNEDKTISTPTVKVQYSKIVWLSCVDPLLQGKCSCSNWYRQWSLTYLDTSILKPTV